MKIRTDFVTNSSSVSFLCVNCGREEAGRDDGYDDVFDFMSCPNHHQLCGDCYPKNDDGDEPTSAECPVCMLKSISYSNVVSYAKKYKDFNPDALRKEMHDKYFKDDGSGWRTMVDDLKDKKQ